MSEPPVAPRWRPYRAYKDSGAPWLGKIPEHWGVKRLKTVARFEYGESLAADDREDGNIPVFGSNGPVGVHSKANTLSPALVIGRKGSYGKIHYSDEPCFAIDTTFFVDRRASSACLRWLFYVLPLLGLDKMSADSAIPGLSREVAYAQLLPAAPPPEQRAIAAFLDRETAHIDALLAKKERLLQLLAEKRTALISHAVTRGLDAGAPLKESGVPWLRKIPTHWEVHRVRSIATSIQTGPFGSQLHSGDYVSGGVPLVNPSHMKDGRIVPDVDCTVDDATLQRLARHMLEEGDIVFARRGEMGRCALVTKKESGWLCGTGSLRVRLDRELCYPPFLSWLLSTGGIGDWLLLESVGSTMDNLSSKIVAEVPVSVPSVTEQHAIADYLDRETAKLDALAAKVREGMERLREYRAALIAAAVTGKVDVRGAAVHE